MHPLSRGQPYREVPRGPLPSVAVPGWEANGPLDVALSRSTCTGVPGGPCQLRSPLRVLPSSGAGTGASEKGAAAGRAQSGAGTDGHLTGL